ncbi:MAG: suppressor of fused domain protein [Verrucomicrobiota bacterium JB023]|nr:suppressor of fused domain protein [Verrucomicrobiota bacterium JB023]
MINTVQTRQNLKQWVASSAFDEYLKTIHPLPKWRFILGTILTISPLFPFGIALLISGFRKSSEQKQARFLAKKEAAQWEPAVCAIVIANSQALATPGAKAPSALVGAFGSADDAYMNDLVGLMSEVGGLYGSDPKTVPPEHQEFTAIINDDTYQKNRRRPVPSHLTRGRSFLLFDTILESNYFPNNQIDSPFVVCAGNPLTSGTFIHLPPQLIVWEQNSTEPYDPNIIRHQAPTHEPPIVAPVSENLPHLESHIEQFFGTPDSVFHELISTTVHIDLHIIRANKETPWHTIVTTGMSDIPMTTPEGAEEYRLAELILRLPPSWPIGEEHFKDEKNYWPLRQMKFLARFAHEFQTWLCFGHTIPNGDPPEPYCENNPFSGVLLSDPYWADEKAARCVLPDGHAVNFWSLNFLYESEMTFKLSNGAEPLLEKLITQGYGDYVEIRREPVC